MKVKDMFGNWTDLDPPKKKTGWLEVKAIRNYRLADLKAISCKTCEHLVRKDGYANTYYKCNKISLKSSASSDVRLKNVCDIWEQSE